jgi:hypothetical protein
VTAVAPGSRRLRAADDVVVVECSILGAPATVQVNLQSSADSGMLSSQLKAQGISVQSIGLATPDGQTAEVAVPPPAPAPKKELPLPILAGAAGGAALLIAVLTAVACCTCKRRRRARELEQEEATVAARAAARRVGATAFVTTGSAQYKKQYSNQIFGQ